jgi:hypothetical protein
MAGAKRRGDSIEGERVHGPARERTAAEPFENLEWLWVIEIEDQSGLGVP